jgi:hypothetical protein
VQRVLTNHWIYRARIGQPLDSLTAAVTGDWPLYRSYDSGDTGPARLSEKKP